MYKRLICKTKEGISVYEVHGREVRDDLSVEFALGGHGAVYPKFIPDNEVWVEELPDSEDQCFNINQNLAEMFLMRLGTGYREAHLVANKLEKRERRLGRCKPCGGAKTDSMIEEMIQTVFAFLPG
jgi:hypothetical protein